MGSQQALAIAYTLEKALFEQGRAVATLVNDALVPAAAAAELLKSQGLIVISTVNLPQADITIELNDTEDSIVQVRNVLAELKDKNLI